MEHQFVQSGNSQSQKAVRKDAVQQISRQAEAMMSLASENNLHMLHYLLNMVHLEALHFLDAPENRD
jgi:hypothetical protein